MSARLMVVDDEEAILFSVHDYFTQHGWEVDCAREVEEAAALASVNDYDLVITDLHLSGLHRAEGLDLVMQLRARSSAKLMVFTAYGTGELERAALDRGAHAFVQKTTPISQIERMATELVRVPAE